jgi:hypothetical protein
MTVYSREQWGSTGAPGGYDILGPVAEVYVHHFGGGIQPARSVDEAMSRMRSAQAYHRSLGWLPRPATDQTAAMDYPTTDLHVEVVPAERVAPRAVGSEQLVVDVASPTVDVGCLGDGLEVVGPKASRVAAQVVDHVSVWDGRNEHLVSEPVHHHVRAAALTFDHAVPGFRGLAGPQPAAALGIDNRANPQAIGEVMYAEHRITSPGVWSHAPGRPTGAGATAFHSTGVDGGRG